LNAEELCKWLDDKLRVSRRSTLPIYVGQFESMWIERFGSVDSIPKGVRDKINRRYKELKASSK
jgi:hypothetical protein